MNTYKIYLHYCPGMYYFARAENKKEACLKLFKYLEKQSGKDFAKKALNDKETYPVEIHDIFGTSDVVEEYVDFIETYDTSN